MWKRFLNMDVKDVHGKHVGHDLDWRTSYSSSYLFERNDLFFSTSQLVRLSSQEKRHHQSSQQMHKNDICLRSSPLAAIGIMTGASQEVR